MAFPVLAVGAALFAERHGYGVLPLVALPPGAEFVVALVAARPRALRRARAAAPRAVAVAAASHPPQRSAVRLLDGAALPSGRAARHRRRCISPSSSRSAPRRSRCSSFESARDRDEPVRARQRPRARRARPRAARGARHARPAPRSPLGVRRRGRPQSRHRVSRGGTGCSARTRRSPRTGTSAWPSASPTSRRTRPRASPGCSPRRSCRPRTVARPRRTDAHDAAAPRPGRA